MTPGRIRLDKWLWAARFARSRTAAQTLCTAGLIRVGGLRVEKASREIRIGDILTIPMAHDVLVVRVLGGAERRLGPAAARGLYEVLEDDASPPR